MIFNRIAMKNAKQSIALLEDQACVGRRVTELTEATQLSRPAVSPPLKFLKQAK